MSPLIALYTKEIKDNRKLFLFLLIGTVCLDLWVLFTIETNVLAAFICGLPIWSTVFILLHHRMENQHQPPPALLAYSPFDRRIVKISRGTEYGSGAFWDLRRSDPSCHLPDTRRDHFATSKHLWYYAN